MADQATGSTALESAPAADAALREPQTVTVEQAGPARVSLTIEVPADRIARKIEDGYKRLQDETVLPGFRRGHAPKSLLQKRFGQAIRDEIRGQLLSEAYTQAIEENSIDVIGEPEVKELDKLVLPETGPLTFKVEVEVSPKVELPDFSTIEVKKAKAEVTDADVDAEIKQLAERHGKMNQVTEGAIAAEDYAQATVKILAGADAKEGAEVLHDVADSYIYVRGKDNDFKGHVAGIIIDDLGQRLIGKNIGDELTISTTGPAGHENDKIKNQPITIQIKITKIERMEPAAVDTLPGRFGLASVDELKTRVREMLQDRAQRREQQAQHQQVCDQLIEKVQMELPAGLSSRQTIRVLRRKANEMAYAGVPEKEIEQRLAELRNGSEEEAKRQLKLFFILDKAAEQLKIEVGEGEVNGRIAMLAMQQGRRPEKLRQQMMRSGEVDQIYLQVREQKTLDAILGSAKVTEA